MSELAFNRVILEKNNQVLAILGIASLALNLILSIILTTAVQKPPLIVYEDTEHMSALRLKKYKIEEDIIKDFTTMIVSQYLNFNYVSLTNQIDGISPYLAPRPLDAILESYKRNQFKMEKENISQEFIVGEMKITKKKNPFWIEVQGVRVINADGNKKNDEITYIFEIGKVNPTQSNPYGLQILDVVEKKDQDGGKKK
ncbi:MAG: TraE/TraK family type IV conjugative transfer system protein [Candidatus Omnitrophota bacterium]|nr:TraE/TraK family type IV conjugative transfer system protein [Candidatus Omnitrophota bacterium]